MKKLYSYLLLPMLLLLSLVTSAQSTLTATYDDGDIPTGYTSFDATCNGASTALTLALPATGGSWEVTSVDVVYDMTAHNSGWMSEQRSKIYFENNDVGESSYTSGSGNAGTYQYDRSGLILANGYYDDGENLTFQMRAYRTGYSIDNDCSTYTEKVDDGTWTVTVNYQAAPTCFPQEDVDVSSKTIDQAEITWEDKGSDDSPAATWDIEYGPTDFTLGSGTSVSATTNPYTITGLTEHTTYDVYVRSDCGAGDVGEWSDVFTFTTPMDCSTSNLEITSTTGSTITCKGSGVLESVSSGDGDEVYWYDAATGGNLVGVGAEYVTPYLDETTSYWASEVALSGGGVKVEQGLSSPSSYSPVYDEYGLAFTATEAFTIISVEVFSAGNGGDLEINLVNDAGVVLETATVTLPSGAYNAQVAETVALNFEVPGSGDYKLVSYEGSPSMGSSSSFPSIGYPFDLGSVGEITSGVSYGNPSDTSYYFFYNWTINEGGLDCQSDRVEAIATISDEGDVEIASLPYTTTDDTANYDNTYSGNSGSDCGSEENYLNGNDVVYTFTPAEDDVWDIELSGLSGFYAGVFVYESCENLGEACSVGSVAGPSDDNFGIYEFHVIGGQQYYIVISSWLNPSVEYTLTIDKFDCATFEAPIADSAQNFVDGDTVEDLAVEATMGDTSFVYYSDAAGTTEIPASTDLTDGTTYYIAQQFVDCVSALQEVTVSEIDCGALEITSTAGNEVSCRGVMELHAEASGEGQDVYWYDAETDGAIVGVGEDFTTPDLTNTASYWAAEEHIKNYGVLDGQGVKDWSHVYNVAPNSESGLIFEASAGFLLKSVDVFSGANGGDLEVFLYDSDGNQMATTVVYLPSGTGSDPTRVTIPLNVFIPEGAGYRLVTSDGPAMKFENLTGSYDGGFPFAIGDVGQIMSSSAGGNSNTNIYYYFYNWSIVKGDAVCESPRVEVVAEVTSEGDVSIDALPYEVTSNTTLYSNDFSGVPGKDCGSGDNYLTGNDVVYLYTPTEDDILDIDFEDLTSDEGESIAGVFVYTSCGKIGEECFDGATADGELEFGIQDVYVTGGQNYFIVISTKTTDVVGYKMTVNGFDCDTSESPIGAEDQDFVDGFTLADLDAEQSPFSDGLTYYSDAEGAMEIPDTTELVDGTTYYVSQTVLGCESTLLAITAREFDCDSLEVVSITDGYVCQSGSVSLEAETGGTGSKVFWYDVETDGDVVGIGETFNTPAISSTTSYWATEVFISGEEVFPGQGLQTWSDDSMSEEPYSGYEFGLVFDASQPFTLKDVEVFSTGLGGSTTVKLLNDGGDELEATEVKLPKGTNDNPVSYTIDLGYEITPGDYKLIVEGNAPMKWENEYPQIPEYPIELANGGIGEITGGVSFGNPSPSDYYFLYNWTIKAGEVQCESERIEAVVNVNTDPTDEPTGDAEQSFCEGSVVGDIALTIEDEGALQWYTSDVDVNGTVVTPSTVLEDGLTYYASQLYQSCESAARFAVTVSVTPKAEMPVGDSNQSYYDGDVLSDLDVEGQNLTWYADAEGAQELPDTTELSDQVAYYVGQSVEGQCGSELLKVTVHRLLSVRPSFFTDLRYYPNPMNEVLNLTNSENIDDVEFYNLLGQKVISKKPNATNTTVDVSRLANGIYLMRVIIDGKVATFKMIKE